MTHELAGMAVVGRYGDRFAADTAGALLAEAGFEAAVIGDPAASIAPHLVTTPGFRLVVRTEAASSARAVLGARSDAEADALDAWFYERRFADRPTWIRVGTWLLIAAFPLPLAIAALGLMLYALASAFPS